MSEQTGGFAVYADIAAVTKRLAGEGIGKDRENKVQGYTFRGIDDIYNSVGPAIAEQGLCILPQMLERVVVEHQSKAGGLLLYVTVKAQFDFVSSKDGSRCSVVMYGEAMDSGDKATNKAMSAAFKYACMQVFCIPVAGDDADAHSPELVKTAKDKPRPEQGDAFGEFTVGKVATQKKDNPSNPGLVQPPQPPPTPLTVGQRVAALMEKHGKGKPYFASFFGGFLGVDALPADQTEYLPALLSIESHESLPQGARQFGADCARSELEVKRFAEAMKDINVPAHLKMVGITDDPASERLAYLRVLALTSQAPLMKGIRNLSGISFAEQVGRITGEKWSIDDLQGKDIDAALAALAAESAAKKKVIL